MRRDERPVPRAPGATLTAPLPARAEQARAQAHVRQPQAATSGGPGSAQGARAGSSSACPPAHPQHLPDELLPQGQGLVAGALRRPHGRSPLVRPLSSPRCRGGAAAAAHAGRPRPEGARPRPLPLRAVEPAALCSGAWWICRQRAAPCHIVLQQGIGWEQRCCHGTVTEPAAGERSPWPPAHS